LRRRVARKIWVNYFVPICDDMTEVNFCGKKIKITPILT
jgi:hypothetical protein